MRDDNFRLLNRLDGFNWHRLMARVALLFLVVYVDLDIRSSDDRYWSCRGEGSGGGGKIVFGNFEIDRDGGRVR